MYKKVFYFLSFVFQIFILSQTVFAHDILLTLSKENMTTLQHNLIDKGYLATSSVKVFGVYNAATEDAFNKWQIEKDRQNYANNNFSNFENTDNSSVVKENILENLLESLIDFFKSLF